MSVYALIPLLPLLAFLILAFGGRFLGEASHKVGAPAVGLALALSIGAFISVATSGPISIPFYRLLDVGSLTVDVNLYVDQLTVLLLLLVTGGSFVVHVYSASYMIGDPRYSRFFAVMALFTFAMVMLVMSNNLLVTYMCWEVMGICSYLLISHWAHRQAACRAATKAFLVNAVADVGLGFGVILTFATYRTLDIQQILSAASSVVTTDINLLAWFGFDYAVAPNTLITLCLLIGALGKSAQFPMHVWLPFAMEAPTPVSALIHAATMVNAGPFLLVRLSPLVLLAPNIMIVIAIVGATTALYGGLVSLTQPDIKKLLAYSTISQIGFMVFLCGIGAFVAAIFHLLAHGFLKGFLFLSTGNALNSASSHSHTEGDGHVPTGGVARSGLFGALLLACIPPFLLFSGPYERMWSAHQLPSARIAFWVIALSTVFLTASYTFRAVMSLFQQTLSGPAAVRPRLFSPAHVPSLAVAAVLVVGLLIPFWSWFTAFLAPALGAQQVSLEELSPGGGYSPWLVLPLLAAIGGWSLSYYVHLNPSPTSLGRGEWARTAYVFLLNKLYVDEIYEACVVQPVIRFSRWLWRDVDVRGIDGAIRAVAGSSRHFSRWLGGSVEARGVDGAIRAVAGSSRHFSRWLGGSVEARGVDGAIRAVAGSSRHFSRWLGGSVEARGVDGSIRGIASSALRLSSWLWTASEVRTGDRAIRGGGIAAVQLSGWLWRIIDIRGTDQALERRGRLGEGAGEALQRIEPRTLQHHLVVIVFWLVLAIGLSYWLAL